MMLFLRKRENYSIVTMPGFNLGSLILTYTIVCVSEVAKGELEHVLNHYETLHVEDVFHGVHKRDTYTALQEKIFHAYSVGPNDVKTEIPINKHSFYRGYDEDDASSEARVHDDYGVLTASIATKNDTYVIEPAWRHLRQSSNEQMIAYRHSDVKSNITHSHNNPKLALVADYRFHREMGQRDRSKTVNYMIGVADRVNTIFQRTEWSNEYVGYGFEIAQVIVHEDISPRGPRHYYNQEPGGKGAFSGESEWKKYCLAHLFTYQDFINGVIGLAYVGNRKRNAVGGICTEDYFSENKWLYLNTGLSRHNFGSEHDPDTAECAPGDTKAEGGVLTVQQAENSWSAAIEIAILFYSDGYKSPCCRDCVYNNVFIKCREEDTASCKKETYCNGSSPSCPVAESMDDGTECLDRGKCLTGKCLSLCAAENLTPCKCTEQQNACKVCCVISGRCQPHKDNVTGATLDLPNGRTCETEEFQQGTCDKFMKDNLAGTVVVFSLLIWIPGSCYINHQSTKLLREPKPTSKGKFIYRQESISRSSRAHKPYKVKAINIKTNRIPKLEQVRETDF
ncbi:ADAM 17-like protease [Acropora cervicornis]|uniref:ADAM 17-like protease n=1 Tax=Acropora cervicornis TaxID=6130 RepID=A0AAD9Q340_ACRCE|nr:ADAM 17-like protease [Acropora cervicornis]